MLEDEDTGGQRKKREVEEARKGEECKEQNPSEHHI